MMCDSQRVHVCARVLVCVSAINNEVYPMACLMARSMLMATGSDSHALTLKASKHSPKGRLLFLHLFLSTALCSTFRNFSCNLFIKIRSLAFTVIRQRAWSHIPQCSRFRERRCLPCRVRRPVDPLKAKHMQAEEKKNDFVCGLCCHFNHPPSLVESVLSSVQY